MYAINKNNVRSSKIAEMKNFVEEIIQKDKTSGNISRKSIKSLLILK
ncbi:hypothetical protein PRO82_002149 [Candidatus Protochlamydia amoebophila]|nr:hypothetical protein [Candidatus Protochlamydia amoebophila]